MLEAIRDATRRATAPVDEVLDIGDPYDGYNRTLPAAPFLPAVLAACGVAAVSHGVESMGPKYGVTHRQVLRAAGLPVDLGPEEAAARLGDPGIGWAYVDQKAFCPKLYALAGLRTLIVKRPAITTAEVLAGPVRGRLKTHLVTGYVHKPYPRIYALLARHAGFDSALIVRGVEGGVIPALSPDRARCSTTTTGARRQSTEFKPAELGIDQSVRAPRIPGARAKRGRRARRRSMLPRVAKAAAEAGMAALAGAARRHARQPGLRRRAVPVASRAPRFASKAPRDAVREVLDSGRALERLRHQRR